MGVYVDLARSSNIFKDFLLQKLSIIRERATKVHHGFFNSYEPLDYGAF